jgi:serine/threonine protein kinase
LSDDMKICLICEGVSETTQQDCATCGRPLLATEAVHFPLRRGEADAANPLLGTLVDGKYRIHNVLGKGGMGTVFQATHEVSLVPVGLKILNPRFAARREYREYFLAEAQKAGRVIHEHTARIMDVGEAEDGTVYIAMEIVNGITLYECIHGEIPLAPVQVVDVLQQICEALSAAHQAGLVHRDLSTRNVMVASRRGEPFVKILDFGIAKGLPMLPADAKPGATAAPMGFASPPYSAPEHLEGKNVDARADLYSLGVIGYEALARRFPVAGATGKELAEATLKGELIPLDPPAGTAPQLVRLIHMLLARDPAQRPASAVAVLAELRRIRQPGSPLVRTLAVASFVLALVLMTLAFAVPKERLCVIQGNSIDVTAPGRTPDLQVIPSMAITHLRFDYAGFDVRDIVVEIVQGEDRRALSLPPRAADGVVDLAPTLRDLEYVRAELRKASRGGPVDLIFRWRDRPPFGQARLRIDDDPPKIRFELSEQLAGSKILSSHAACCLHLEVSDQSSLSSVTLSCVDLSGDPANPRPIGKPIPLDLDPVPEEIRPLAILGALFAGPKPSMPVGLVVTATDAAGNKQSSARLEFAAVDFAVPKIVPRAQLTAMHDERTADVMLLVDELEEGLAVAIAGPDGLTWDPMSPTAPGTGQLLIRLPKPQTSGFVNGSYQIELRDPAGNRSPEPFRVEIVFRSTDVDVQFELGQRDPDTRALRMVELTGPERLVWDGRELRIPFTYDAFYTPREVRLKHKGTRLRGDLARFVPKGPGEAAVQLGAVEEDDTYELELVLRPTDAEQKEIELRKTLVVVRKPLVLHLASATSPYLPGLENLFLRQESPKPGLPVLHQGPSWKLVPDRPRLVRGSVLTGSSADDLAPMAIDPDSSAGKLLPPLGVRIGRNLIFLQLTDVLERPVTLEGASTPKTGRCKIADFFYYPDVAQPRSTEPAIQLEAGQSARLILDSPYPFTARDKVLLQLPAARPLRARVRPAEGGGTVLEFTLPYNRLRLASLRDDEALRQEGLGFRIVPDLQTPAGNQKLDLQVRTIRSALTRCALGELFKGAPAQLGSIVMVPVLSPRAEFTDPVGKQFPWRAKFRPQPPITVQNIQDCFLQQGELTRRQYEAIVARALPKLAADGDAWRGLVFPADPEAKARLTPRGMLPAVHRGDRARWQQRLRDAPERPVTGVSFHQAYAATRLLGWLLARDPDLFRLPLGVEMELGVLGPDRPEARLNGSLVRAGAMTYAHHRRAQRQMVNAASWPPTRAESDAMGDRVAGPRGTLVGLDFGVREWVMDLPWLRHPAKGTIRGLQSDYARHLRASTGFLANADLKDVRQELAALGVVRGLALGEVRLLRDALDPDGGRPGDARLLPATVPGVVRTLHLRRDGSGALPDELDPHLDRVGLRLCGGAAFVAEVRRR